MINKEGVWVLDPTKAASSEREIHIGQTLVYILKKHRIWLIKNKLNAVLTILNQIMYA